MKNTRLVPFLFVLILAGPCLHATVAASGRVADRLSVCVYCGASELVEAKYVEVARQVGAELARRQWTLVWGGSKTGLMGAVARGTKESGGRIVGILPEFIRQWEVAYDRADEMIAVTTMHERKLLLQVRSDVFVVLPGGIGTLDEIADTLDLRNLGQHHKPIILLNQDGYYDALLAFLDNSIREKFTKDESRKLLQVAKTVDEMIVMIEHLDPK